MQIKGRSAHNQIILAIGDETEFNFFVMMKDHINLPLFRDRAAALLVGGLNTKLG